MTLISSFTIPLVRLKKPLRLPFVASLRAKGLSRMGIFSQYTYQSQVTNQGFPYCRGHAPPPNYHFFQPPPNPHQNRCSVMGHPNPHLKMKPPPPPQQLKNTPHWKVKQDSHKTSPKNLKLSLILVFQS